MTDIASQISIELRFIIKWVEKRLLRSFKPRPGTHDLSVMLMFAGGDQVQYTSNVHRQDAADLMVDLLKRWNAQGTVVSDIPYHVKRDDTSADQLQDALVEEIVSLMAEPKLRGFPTVDVVILLEEVILRTIRMISKKNPESRIHVMNEIAKQINKRFMEEQ